MSVASRITSMTEHIQNAYDSIERFGVDTESIDKNLVNLSNTITNEIYDKLPKVSGNGSNFALENAQNGKLDLFEMEGNTHQNSYTGKNLYGISDYSNTTNGVEITIKDGVITLNGTCTNTTTLVINSKDEQILNGNYTTSLNKISGTYTGTANVNFRHFSDDSVINGTQLSFTVLNKKITVSNEKVKYGIYFEKNSVFDNFKFRPQLVVGTEPDYDYEPYVGGTPSPNPDYPQDIEVVKGDNTIKVTGKNLFDKNNANIITAYIGENQNWTYSGSAVCYRIKCKPNTSYTISLLNTNETIFRGAVTDSEDIPTSGHSLSIYSVVRNTNNTPIIVNTTTDSKYILVQLSAAQYLTSLETLQLEQGSTATPYEPYHNKDYEIDLGNIELCKIGDYQDSIKKSTGKNLFDKSTITTSAYLKEDGTLQTGTGVEYVTSDFIPVKPNTTYYKALTLSPRTKFYDANKQVLDNTTYQDVSIGGNAGSFTTPSNAYYFRFTGNVKTSTGININLTIINEGTTALPYEPYGKVWYLNKQIGKVVLDGSESWTTRQGGTSYAYQLFNVFDGTGTNGKCDYWNFKSRGATNSQNEECICSANTNTSISIFTNNNTLNSIENFKSWLGTNNVSVYYILATPTYEKITNETLISQLETIETETGTNIFEVSNDNDVLPSLNVKRLKELEKLS